MGKYRDRPTIIAELLKAATAGSTKTHLMYNTYTSSPQMNAYLKTVIDCGLIRFDDGHYFTTQKGLQFIELVNRMHKLIGTEGQEIAIPVR